MKPQISVVEDGILENLDLLGQSSFDLESIVTKLNGGLEQIAPVESSKHGPGLVKTLYLSGNADRSPAYRT